MNAVLSEVPMDGARAVSIDVSTREGTRAVSLPGCASCNGGGQCLHLARQMVWNTGSVSQSATETRSVSAQTGSSTTTVPLGPGQRQLAATITAAVVWSGELPSGNDAADVVGGGESVSVIGVCGGSKAFGLVSSDGVGDCEDGDVVSSGRAEMSNGSVESVASGVVGEAVWATVGGAGVATVLGDKVGDEP